MRKAKLKRDITYFEGKVVAYDDILNILNLSENNHAVLMLRDYILKNKAKAVAEKKKLLTNLLPDPEVLDYID